MIDNCAILILSCDKNKGLLNIFYDFFKKNWADCPFKVYLGIESNEMHFSGFNIMLSEKETWGARFQDYLSKIQEEYIFLILDDFIVEEPVDTEKICNYLKCMENDTTIATISIAEIYDNQNYECGYEELNLVRRIPKADYLLNMQVGLWRKSILQDLIKAKESPWQTELFGSIRARKLKDNQFLCLKSDKVSPYKYGRGWLMVRGCWNGNEIKRLKLENCIEDIFDGKDIMFSPIPQIKLWPRILRRIQITYRKILSNVNIYV